MKARDVQSIEDAKAIVLDRNITHIKLGLFDADGIMRGKYIHKDKFFSALDEGFGFCDVVLGWDSNDQLYDNVNYTGWHTGYPDAPVRILPNTCREIPFEPDTLLFLCEFTEQAEAICPRGTLRRVIEKAKTMGYNCCYGACEFEFFVFNETPESCREKNYNNLNTFTQGNCGYSILRSTVKAELYQSILQLSESMDFPIEGLHTETGPGVLEAAIAYDEILASADKAALFKTYTKILAQRQELMATFMARWSTEQPGQSGHLHISLIKSDGSAAFYDPSKADNMSDEMRWFIGGQQKLMPQVLAMVALSVNSYSRLVPGFWAPTVASWGVDNRTCAIRAIPGSSKSQRIEYRIAGADINPYLALAAALGSGLWGIENQIEPTAPVVGNAYEQSFDDSLKIPATLIEAAQNLQSSKAARELFGDDFVDHFANTRKWEEREFRKHITDWEMQRYFELI